MAAQFDVVLSLLMLSQRFDCSVANPLRRGDTARVIAFPTVFTCYRSAAVIAAAWELGVAHPPGYPLFVLATKAFATLLPVGSVAWRANLLSALFASFGAD